MKRRSFLALSLLCSSAFAQFKVDLPVVDRSLIKGFDSMTIPDAKKHLGYLAGPECEGRGTGEPGYEKAVAYMSDQFKKLGLKSVMPDGSFMQYNEFWRSRVDPSSVKLSIGTATANSTEVGVAQNGNISLTGPAVVLVLNSSATSISPEQLKQLEGKIVFLMGSAQNRAMRTALNNAAKSVVRVDEKVSTLGWTGRATEPPAAGGGRLSISRSGLERLLGKSIFVPKFMDVSITDVNGEVTLTAQQQVEKIKVANVVAKLEGSDPVLKNEFIGVGAHLDHLGRRGDVIYYGADDDGSGCTALLQLAKGLTSNPVKPKRSVIFMAFYGEEMGLLGSRYITDNPPIDLTKMIAELQMDMVGRNSSGAQNGDQKRIDVDSENTDTIRLVGSKRISTRLDQIIQEQNKHIGFRFKYDAEDVYTRSDHYMFARKGIPVAFYFSGFHPDYHQPTDTIEKINFLKLNNTAKLNYLVIHALGNESAPLPKN